MAKKVRFPLEMKNSFMARTLEELKENFDLEKIISHLNSGKLITWLNDRYYEEEADKIMNLDYNSKELNKIICEIFEVEYCESFEIDIEEIERVNQRKDKLKQFTTDESILNCIDKVAFNQEELAELLDEDTSLIYLCGEKFIIPIRRVGVEYIGINNPTVVIKSKEEVDFESRNIKLKGIKFNEEYQELINVKSKDISRNNEYLHADYKTSELVDFMMKSNDRKESKKLFDIIAKELPKAKYNNEKITNRNVDIIRDANLLDLFNNYIEKIN